MRHRFSRKFVLLAIFIWLFGFISGAFQVNASEVIKVGFFEFDGYHMMDSDGERSGYGYEILQHMAGYAGFKYDYIGYDKSWSEMQEMLETGEIDLLTSAQKTDSRLEKFDFSTLSIGSSSAILTTKIGNTEYVYNNYSNWNGMKVGMIQDNSRNTDFAEYALENNFTYEAVFYTDTDQMVLDLKQSHNIDAILTSNLRSIENETIIAQFDPSPFFIMVKKGNTALLNKVNSALLQMDTYEAGFRTLLMNKYYSVKNVTDIPFTNEERIFIQNMQSTTFKAIISPDMEPYSYLENGKPTGSIYDATNEMINRSGLNIEFVEVKDEKEYFDVIESGDYDIRFDSFYSYALSNTTNTWLTPSYVEIPVARLHLENSSSYDTAALLKNMLLDTDYLDTLVEDGITIEYYSSIEELVKKVKNDTHTFGVLPIDSATAAVRDDIKNRLTSEQIYGVNIELSIAIKDTSNSLLYSIIKKSASSITEDEMNSYIQSYADNIKKDFSIIGFMYDNPGYFAMILVGIGLILAVIATLVLLIRKRKRALIQVELEKKRNKALAEAVDKATKADIAKSSFMSRMSHEIRTPLNAVIGYNTIARNELTTAKTDEDKLHAELKTLDCLTKSEIASKHLLSIINDVLDMSAIESGKIKVALDRFDFKGLINSLTTVFYSQAKAKGIELQVTLDSVIEEWFVGDQMRINQVITNLLSNAMKFTPEGGSIRFNISQTAISDEKAELKFEISDTGIGMSSDFLQKLWNPFEQADATISRRFGGTGLGLSITKNLVELMKGNISVESELGKGTKFTVSLTLQRASQDTFTASYDFSKINALFIDDDSATCDYMKLLLARFGARCTTATSGEDGFTAFTKAKATNDKFTLCFVDWKMPGMNGVEVIKEIKKNDDDDTPIIVVTAYDFSEIMEEVNRLNVTHFLAKPLFQSSIFNLIAEISGKAKRQTEDYEDKSFNGANIMLVEDNEMNMEISKNLLATAGVTITEAWNGKEAVEIFTNSAIHTFDVILMDVQMPIMDGHEATKMIRLSIHPEAKTIPIIAMSADAFSENIAEALAAGMNDHVSKPIDLKRLFEVLRKYVTIKK